MGTHCSAVTLMALKAGSDASLISGNTKREALKTCDSKEGAL
jgi:hypothetical protein